jgi:predicted nucleic acid-binding protein
VKTVTAEDSYLDTSFLFKFYIPEPDSGDALKWLKARRGDILTSALSDIEMITSFSRESSSVAGYRAMDNYRDDCRDGMYRKLEVDAEVFEKSRELAESHAGRYRLRSLDILHLATALRHGVTSLGSYDKRLAEAGRALGLNVFPVSS